MERDQALKFMHDLLRLMLQKNGSDLFITTGFPPAIKIDGRIVPQSNQALAPGHTSDLARAIMTELRDDVVASEQDAETKMLREFEDRMVGDDTL